MDTTVNGSASLPTPVANSSLRGVVHHPPRLASTGTAEVVRRLELTVTRRLDGMLQGDYRGLVPGHGSEPGEARAYQAGDDVRRIDWNVTARMSEPHVRDSVADRELETWVLLDTSASLAFGTTGCEKRDLLLAALAAVGLLTARTGNRTGAVFLEGPLARTVPARGGRANLMALLHGAADSARREHPGQADLAAGLRRMASVAKRRGLVVVLSDFLGPTGWERSMRALSARHEVLAVEALDPRELTLPDVGVIDLVDPETGRVVEVASGSERTRAAFARAAAEQRADIARRIRAAGADHLTLRTDRDWLVDLVRFVALRRERIEAIGRSRRAVAAS